MSATIAAGNLNRNNMLLQKSLARLSSGSKITTPADDAGGLAVSMKLDASIARTDATSTNVANAISFMQVQDGSLKSAGQVLTRISELKLLSTDVTKSASDIANYNSEFLALQSQLTSTAAGTFNGVALFAAGAAATTLAVGISEDGAQTQNISQSALLNAIGLGAGAAGTNPGSAASIGALVLGTVTTAIQNVATARAQNGAESSRLGFNADLLATNRTNLEAANSRIVDTDIASESTRMARFNILVQGGSAMLAQANSTSQSVLRLLQ
jgi:flagellin